MRVLHIIDSGGLYGAETVLLNLAMEQEKAGVCAVIASIGEKGIGEKPLETEAQKRGIDAVKFRMTPGPNLPGMLRVLRYAVSNNFDILHSHGFKGNVAFGFIPKRLRRLPLVATLHGYTGTEGLSKKRIYEWLDLKSLRHIDAVVLVSRGMLSNRGISRMGHVDFHVVNNGIPDRDLTTDGPEVRQPDLEIAEFCSRGFTVGSIGRLSPEKGHRYLIGALGLLVKRGIDARVVILGEGGEREALKRQAEDAGVPGRVLMPGYRADAGDYLPCFNIFALPSLTEGLSITLLEAMQAGVPVIASRVGGIPEVLEDGLCGMLVEPSREDLLAEGIYGIFHRRNEARQAAERARMRVRDHYSIRAMAGGYLRIYEELLKDRSRKTEVRRRRSEVRRLGGGEAKR
jgi:glycosyltransferase involved in cell wall biosynthesis